MEFISNGGGRQTKTSASDRWSGEEPRQGGAQFWARGVWLPVSGRRRASPGRPESGAKSSGEPAMWTSGRKMVQAEGTVSAKAPRQEPACLSAEHPRGWGGWWREWEVGWRVPESGQVKHGLPATVRTLVCILKASGDRWRVPGRGGA